MPEIPDIEAYIAALRERVLGEQLRAVRITGPFLLRTFDPLPAQAVGRRVVGIRRMGKRIVFELASSDPRDRTGGPVEASEPIFMVVHLMIAGRLHWKPPGAPIPKGSGLAAFDFEAGSLTLTESGTKKRASLHLVRGRDALEELDPGGLEVMGSSVERFAEALTRESRTVKRALTDPRLFSGIGNAYSDEILHRACLSPLRKTRDLDPGEIARLHEAVNLVLGEWVERLIAAAGTDFPERVTAFRPEMAVHGRYGKLCPTCGSRVERIVYADNECNYCPVCQTGSRILADRALSRLLKDDWPTSREK